MYTTQLIKKEIAFICALVLLWIWAPDCAYAIEPQDTEILLDEIVLEEGVDRANELWEEPRVDNNMVCIYTLTALTIVTIGLVIYLTPGTN